MAFFRNPLSRAVMIGGVVTTDALPSVVWVYISGDLGWSLPYMLLAFAILCLLVLWGALSWLERRIIRPLGVVSSITLRIAEGELAIPAEEIELIGDRKSTRVNSSHVS